ncbi:MAG: U32 family peptidase, partial [Bacilli bacterium]|nr:U32 family peptidase [Bacilli bacterium]
MRIVATLKNKDEIALLAKIGADAFLLETNLFTRAAESPLSLETIKELVKAIHRRRKKAYVLLNTLIHEADIAMLDEYLEELRRIKIDAIVCYDLTVILVASKHKLEKLCIYQPGTMSTHPKNLAFYEQLGIKGVTISREITLEEIMGFFTEETKIEFSLMGHGYQEMFYSQRKLVSAYLNHQGLPHDTLAGANLSIREKQRLDQFFPIVEDGFGTQIFRAKKLASF